MAVRAAEQTAGPGLWGELLWAWQGSPAVRTPVVVWEQTRVEGLEGLLVREEAKEERKEGWAVSEAAEKAQGYSVEGLAVGGFAEEEFVVVG